MQGYVVSKTQLSCVLDFLSQMTCLAADSETTGLKTWHGAKMFSLSIATQDHSFYFNFRDKGVNCPPEEFHLSPRDLLPLFERPKAWAFHNAKFDMHFLDSEGLCPKGDIYDTEVLARLDDNRFAFTKGGYSLDACSERYLGEGKDPSVKEWLVENKAFTVHFGKDGRPFKHFHFDWVPFAMISKYGRRDAWLTKQLYRFFLQRPFPGKMVRECERALTPTLFHMEKRGVFLDVPYTERAFEYEKTLSESFKGALDILVKDDFVDSEKMVVPRLLSEGFILHETEKGGVQIDDKALKQKDSVFAKTLLSYRRAKKRHSTYFANYLDQFDSHSLIHTNFRQSGTVTGRMSCSEPNLQNIPKRGEDDQEFPIRRCFVPRADFIFVSIDYMAMEFRLMLDYAGQTDLIYQIIKGLDPHDATAQLTGLSRPHAKTLNFGLLYGMGNELLAESLGVGVFEARRFKEMYFRRLPKVKLFIDSAKSRQKTQGLVRTWAGREAKLDRSNPKRDFSYKAANSIIQGGCADICKAAMVALHKFLEGMQSQMVLQIHDEIIFEIHKDELDIVPEIAATMEAAYICRAMPMKCSISYSTKSLHDMLEVKDWDAEKAGIGKGVSDKSLPRTKNSQSYLVF